MGSFFESGTSRAWRACVCVGVGSRVSGGGKESGVGAGDCLLYSVFLFSFFSSSRKRFNSDGPFSSPESYRNRGSKRTAFPFFSHFFSFLADIFSKADDPSANCGLSSSLATSKRGN